MRCFLCNKQAKRMKTLNSAGIKCLNKLKKYGVCNDKDTFCIECNESVHRLVARTRAKQQRRREGSDVSISLSSAEGMLHNNSDNSTSTTNKTADNVDELVAKTPQHPQNKRVARDINTRLIGPTPKRQRRDEGQQHLPVNSSSTSQEQLPSSQELLSGQSSAVIPISQEQIPPVPILPLIEEPESSDDELPPQYRAGLPCSSSSEVVQPIIRRRRTPVTFPDPRIIPIYTRRGNFGG